MRFLNVANIAALFVPILSLANTIEVTSQNLKSYLEKNNSKVSASKLEVEASSYRQGLLVRSFLPSLEIYGGQESFKAGTNPQKYQPTYGAEVKINLFNGWRDKLENNVRNLDTEKLHFQAKRVFSEELEKARSQYWHILYLRDKLSLLTTSLEINRQNLGSAQRRIKSGVATDSDRFEFEMKDVDLSRELEETKVELATKTKLFAILIGTVAETELLFTEQLSHDHEYEALLKHNFKDHEFLFKEQEIQSDQLLQKSKSSSRMWWPKIDAFAAYNQFNQREKDPAMSGERTESVFGIRATISLSAGFEQSREASALIRESDVSRILAGYQKQEIEVHLFGEMEELKLLHNQVHDAEENIKRAERYYKLTQSEYGRGVKNSPDVLGASEKFFDMQHKRLEIIRNFQLAKAHVLSKIGK